MTATSIFNLATTLIFVASLYSWAIVAFRASHQQTVLPWSPRRAVPWHVVELLCSILILLCTLLLVPHLISSVLGIEIQGNLQALPPADQLYIIMASSIGMLVGSFFAAIFLRMRSDASMKDLGFDLRHILSDLRYGVISFVMLVVPVLLLQLVLNSIFPNANKHPFVELMQDSPNSNFIWLIFIAAVCIAPLVEEFLFRVVFQGWLEKISVDAETGGAVASGGSAAADSTRRADGAATSDSSEARLVEASYDTTHDPGSVQEPTSIEAGEAARPTNWMPIIVSALIFAICHSSHGTAPIPLFFLATGLGYLYQRTHRIWPSLVVHILINLVAVIQLQIIVNQVS